MAVTVKPDANFTASAPRVLFKMPINDRGAQMAAGEQKRYAPAGNGQRFLINADLEEPAPPVTVVLNWPAALRR